MISVIIPIYNTGKLLNRMLQSIQEQSYKDLEIILINDGSTDESGQECQNSIFLSRKCRGFICKKLWNEDSGRGIYSIFRFG